MVERTFFPIGTEENQGFGGSDETLKGGRHKDNRFSWKFAESDVMSTM